MTNQLINPETVEIVSTLNPTPEVPMVANTNSIIEPAVNSITTNPQVLAEVKATAVVPNLLLIAPSDSVHIIRFKTAVAAALVNPDFLGDVKKVEKATQAATLPNPEDRVRAQLLANAKKTMYANAAKDAEKGLPFVLPTSEEIARKVEEGVLVWRSKQA